MSKRFELARKLAHELGTYAKHARDTMQVHEKGKADYVTSVDVEIEKRFTRKVLQEFPDDRIQGEELTPKVHAVPRWIIDPIDGTKNYVHGFDMWSVSIGYKSDTPGESFGVVFFPDTDTMFYAEEGKGAFLNDSKIHVSKQTHLKKAYTHIDTFSFESHPILSERRWPLYKKIFKKVFRARNIGAASFSLCYTAKGSYDLNVNLTVIQYEWDYYPPMVILKEAGGVYETVNGIALAGNVKIVDSFKKFMKKAMK